MKAVTISSCLVVVLLAILHLAVSLPPDFFRSGRGQMSGEKRAVQEYEIMRGVCSYCGIELGEEFELGCRTGKPSIRKQCALAHYSFVESLMEKNGWKK